MATEDPLVKIKLRLKNDLDVGDNSSMAMSFPPVIVPETFPLYTSTVAVLDDPKFLFWFIETAVASVIKSPAVGFLITVI